MAYYIFLKSLRSLEAFRKNPHVKIPLKSHCTNFPSLGKFKNPILIRKLFFLISARPPPLFSFRPSRGPPPFLPPPRSGPVGQIRSRRPLSPSHVGVFSERHILFDFVHSGRDTFSLSCHCHVGPVCQLHPLPSSPAGQPLPIVASGHPAPPGLQPRDARHGLHSTP